MMQIKKSQLRKMIRETLREMKLGLSSAPRSPDVVNIAPSTEDKFERDVESDKEDEFLFGKRKAPSRSKMLDIPKKERHTREM